MTEILTDSPDEVLNRVKPTFPEFARYGDRRAHSRLETGNYTDNHLDRLMYA